MLNAGFVVQGLGLTLRILLLFEGLGCRMWIMAKRAYFEDLVTETELKQLVDGAEDIWSRI